MKSLNSNNRGCDCPDAGLMLVSCNQRSDSYPPGNPAGNASAPTKTRRVAAVEGTVES